MPSCPNPSRSSASRATGTGLDSGRLLSLGARPAALALDPARALTQYQTRHWGPDEGMPCNNVLAVVQTADGYLWLGTEEGLVRFDGVRTEHFERRSEQLLGRRTTFPR